jgi:hypothetical protein
VHRTFRETGSFLGANAEHEQCQGGEDVLTAVQRSALASTRRSLHRDCFYASHLLHGDDANSEWLQRRLHNLHDIPFTDEAQFTRDEITNTRNSHSWAHENPSGVTICHLQRWFSLDVWCADLGSYLIGPHVIEERGTGIFWKLNYHCI